MELTPEEKRFLELLEEYAGEMFGDKGRKALTDNIPVPDSFEKSFEHNLDEDLPDADEIFGSLQEKGVVEVEEKQEEFNHSQWRVSRDEDTGKREREHTGHVSGNRKVRYFRIPEHRLEELDL